MGDEDETEPGDAVVEGSLPARERTRRWIELYRALVGDADGGATDRDTGDDESPERR